MFPLILHFRTTMLNVKIINAIFFLNIGPFERQKLLTDVDQRVVEGNITPLQNLISGYTYLTQLSQNIFFLWSWREPKRTLPVHSNNVLFFIHPLWHCGASGRNQHVLRADMRMPNVYSSAHFVWKWTFLKNKVEAAWVDQY